MISGQVRVPAFTMRNEPLVRKHVHSASLTALRSIDDGGRDAVLQRAFPTFIWPYFGARGDDGSQRLVLTPPVFDDLRDLVNRHEEDLLEVLQRTFAAQWPGEDADVVAADTLRTMLRELPSRLEETVGRLVAEIAAYKRIQDEYRNRQTAGEILAPTTRSASTATGTRSPVSGERTRPTTRSASWRRPGSSLGMRWSGTACGPPVRSRRWP
jgi:hypothetical protein